VSVKDDRNAANHDIANVVSIQGLEDGLEDWVVGCHDPDYRA
jgi:hypothetical protein